MEGLRFASAGDDIKLWDCGEGFSLVHQFNPHSQQNVASLSWNFDGSLLSSCALSDKNVALTYMKNAAPTTVELQCGTGVQCTDFNSSSRYLACGGVDGVSVWDLKSRTVSKTFKEHKGPVTAVRYNFNGSYVASGSETGEIILHNTVTGQSSSPLVAANAQAIRQLEYSTFKKSMFGTASDDGAITLWDANTRRVQHSFKDAHLGPATGLAFSPINEMLMMSVGLDKRLVCYDIQKKKVLKVIDAQSPLTCLDIMPDGATVAVGSTRGRIYIYNMKQGGGTPIHTFQAHKTSVHSVRFMPLIKMKDDETSGKSGIHSVSSNRRQLPPAPGVMQDITPHRHGQVNMSETPAAVQRGNTPQKTDIFSPTLEGGGSRHSVSATHLSLTNSRGEESYSGVFSPLTNGAVDHSAHSLHGQGSLFSSPSFLGQRTSSLQSPSLQQRNSIRQSPHVAQTSQQNANGPHLPPNGSAADPAYSTQPATSPRTLPQHLATPQGSGASPSLHRSLQVAGEATAVSSSGSFSGRSAAELPPIPPLELSHSQDSALISGGEEGDGEAPHSGSSPRRDGGRDAHSPPSPHSSHGMSPRQGSLTQSHSALRKMLKADLKEYREQLRQEFASMLWGHSGLGPANSAASGRADGAQGPGTMVAAPRDVGSFQSEFLRRLVADAMEEVRDDIHRHIQSLHVEMIRQFLDLQRDIQSQLSYYAQMNQDLILQVRQLQEENRRLQKRF